MAKYFLLYSGVMPETEEETLQVKLLSLCLPALTKPAGLLPVGALKMHP